MDSGSPLVSVILPVFNPGEAIEKCLNSLQCQTLSNIEIIFVDDCGADDSIKIIEKTAETDKRVRIIRNQKNMGAGFSRNIGIESSRGEYLSFVDPDDYVAPDFLELLYRKSEKNKHDIIKGERRIVSNSGEVIKERTSLNDIIRKGIEKNEPLYTLFKHSHWCAIYKREYILNSGIRYGSSRNGQDTTFLLKACYYTDKIELEDNALYYYVFREGSRVRDFTVQRMNYDLDAFKEKMNFLLPRYSDSNPVRIYINSIIKYILQLEAVGSTKEDRDPGKNAFREAFQKYICALPICKQLAEIDPIIQAFVLDNVNLTKDPYNSVFGNIAPEEYYEIVVRWVDYCCDHPDFENENIVNLWYVFEKAITYPGWNITDRNKKRTILNDLRKQAKRLPDVSLFVRDYMSMRLFVYFGINTFIIRDSTVGYHVKRILKMMRDKRRTIKNV